MLARLSALLVLATSACVAVVGCAADDGDGDIVSPSDETDPEGAGGPGNDELVSGRQLNGSNMAPMTINLTFDDGPGRRTIELSDYLTEHGIKATFFINGSKVPGRQGALQNIVDNGHTLANHTHNHKQLTSLSGAQVVKEIADTDALIAAVQPNGPWLLRAPFGAWKESTANAVNGTAMSKYVGSIFWDEGGQLTNSAGADWDCWGKGVSVQRCGDLYLQEIRSKKRGIVLLHDIHDKTVDMIKYIVPKLEEDGYKFTPIEEVPSVRAALGN